MEAIGSIFEQFHSLSVMVIVLLVAVTLGVCVMMVGVFRGDFDNTNNQF
jgi:site-specific recombinase